MPKECNALYTTSVSPLCTRVALGNEVQFYATRQSSESWRNNKVRVTRDSVVFVYTRHFFVLEETCKGGIHEQTFVFTGRVRVHILTEDRPA